MHSSSTNAYRVTRANVWFARNSLYGHLELDQRHQRELLLLWRAHVGNDCIGIYLIVDG